MEAQLATSTVTLGSLAAIGTATKAFVLAHPLSLAAAGGAILALGSYYALGRLFRKKGAASVQAAPVAA